MSALYADRAAKNQVALTAEPGCSLRSTHTCRSAVHTAHRGRLATSADSAQKHRVEEKALWDIEIVGKTWPL